jgi:hypothetical protein
VAQQVLVLWLLSLLLLLLLGQWRLVVAAAGGSSSSSSVGARVLLAGLRLCTGTSSGTRRTLTTGEEWTGGLCFDDFVFCIMIWYM